MSATRIAPVLTRDTFVAAITAAEKSVEAAALTANEDLMQATQFACRSAWLALQEFDGAVTR